MKTRGYARRVRAVRLWAGLLLAGLLAFSNGWAAKRYGARWANYGSSPGLLQTLPDTANWAR